MQGRFSIQNPKSKIAFPAVSVLLVWMVVPLGMTLWFSFQRYNLLNPSLTGFAGINNYKSLLTDSSLWTAMLNTLILVLSVLTVTVVLGTLLAVLFDQEFLGRSVARLVIIAPFFVMPTVSALIWKNMLLHPVNGLVAFLMQSAGLKAIDWFGSWPMTAATRRLRFASSAILLPPALKREIACCNGGRSANGSRGKARLPKVVTGRSRSRRGSDRW